MAIPAVIAALLLAWLSGCAASNSYWYPRSPERRDPGWIVRPRTRWFGRGCAALALLLALVAVT